METEVGKTQRLRILVAIAHHGEKNRRYLLHLIDTYRSFDADVDIVILSEKEKPLPEGVEIRVGAPTEDPWSLPFAHRPLFAERATDYDLFIYSEDDTEIREDHVLAFLEATASLPPDKIAGFLRHEIAPDGQRYCSTIHGPYYWDPASCFEAEGEVYAHYTNDHAAAFILTRSQLAHCIASGGFLRVPHKGRYDMLCSAATDPYTSCGLTKVVRISELERFSLRHLPDIYLGRIGVTWEALQTQISRLISLARNGGETGRLFATEVALDTIAFDKNHEEPLCEPLVRRISAAPGDVLSVGCDAGRSEGALVEAGIKVAAIPIDQVVGASAAARGVEVLPVEARAAREQLGDRRFDYLLFNNVLSHSVDPVGFIRQFSPLLSPVGRIVVISANGQSLRARKAYARHFGSRAALTPPVRMLAEAGYVVGDGDAVRGWIGEAGFTPVDEEHLVPESRRSLSRRFLGLADRWLADRVIVVGQRGRR